MVRGCSLWQNIPVTIVVRGLRAPPSLLQTIAGTEPHTTMDGKKLVPRTLHTRDGKTGLLKSQLCGNIII